MAISRHPLLRYLSTLFATIFLGMGTTYILSPRTGYSLFGFSTTPTTPLDWALMERVMVLFGAKDLFVGVALLAATWGGTRRCAGVVMLAVGACAAIDGLVVKGEAGSGEWNHWGYGSVMGVVGLLMVGVFG